MIPLARGMAVAALQCALVLTLAGKYSYDREHLPRVWVKTAPFDPSLPIRGRYVRLRLEVDSPTGHILTWATLSIQNQRLVAMPSTATTPALLIEGPNHRITLAEPVAFFIPERVPDPSFRQPGEELWVEVSVPHQGPPRPLRLGVKKDGVLTPLELR